MHCNHVSFSDTSRFSSLFLDYLAQKPSLSSFYHRHPSIAALQEQAIEKAAQYHNTTRSVLVSVLDQQYQDIAISKATKANITALKDTTTFTVTTGHQLNLATGPLYFLYKIANTIHLAKKLSKEFTGKKVVPVYWMASEDHDFLEINHFYHKDKKISWNRHFGPKVGALTTKGLQEVFANFLPELGTNTAAKKIKSLLKKAYLEHNTLSEATRFLVNALFGSYGLVIIDADHKALKTEFIPYMQQDLEQHLAFDKVSTQAQKLQDLGYKVQVNPREINLFYLLKDKRARIVFKDNAYRVLDTDLVFSRQEIKQHLIQYPERFSPNVLLRPLYQEVLLPNLAYIGGGGELAYWLELKTYFNAINIVFPVLIARNSVLLKTQKQFKKLEKLNISDKDLFLNHQDFIEKQVRALSSIPLDFSPQKQALHKQFKALQELAKQTHISFETALQAQEKKQIKGLEQLEKRLLKAQKKHLAEKTQRALVLHQELFPGDALQERSQNFMAFSIAFSTDIIQVLVSVLDPLEHEIVILTLP